MTAIAVLNPLATIGAVKIYLRDIVGVHYPRSTHFGLLKRERRSLHIARIELKVSICKPRLDQT